jgi:hypothetical protein
MRRRYEPPAAAASGDSLRLCLHPPALVCHARAELRTSSCGIRGALARRRVTIVHVRHDIDQAADSGAGGRRRRRAGNRDIPFAQMLGPLDRGAVDAAILPEGS